MVSLNRFGSILWDVRSLDAAQSIQLKTDLEQRVVTWNTTDQQSNAIADALKDVPKNPEPHHRYQPAEVLSFRSQHSSPDRVDFLAVSTRSSHLDAEVLALANPLVEKPLLQLESPLGLLKGILASCLQAENLDGLFKFFSIPFDLIKPVKPEDGQENRPG
ncbi:MAG: hypothetical protein SFZ03_04180 [Candidatus Melainabacteria bacterium]|nr:hypothetical protein [Candidatus Melainabacteria bacterium]